MTQEKIDQSAPISTDDLRKLLGAATPGPWEVAFRKNGSAYMSMGGHCRGERHKQFNIGLHDECADDIDDAGLIALAPQLAAEVLALRAGLAAPSAPAEVDGLVVLRKAADAATGDPARYPHRGIIDRYQSAVVAAYENGDLVASTALAEMLDAETRACAEVCNGLVHAKQQRHGYKTAWGAMGCRKAILARLDQRKEKGE